METKSLPSRDRRHGACIVKCCSTNLHN